MREFPYGSLLSKLVQIDTSNPPAKNYDLFLETVAPILEGQLGMEVERIVIPATVTGGEERLNILAHLKNPGMRRLLVYSHIDVVPAEGWDAFGGRIENGKVIGRGSTDMKGSIVGTLYGLFLAKDKPKKWDITLMLTTDEETDQGEQLKYLFEKIGRAEHGVVLDVDSLANYVQVATLGAVQGKISVEGRSVHSGSSHLGVNAVENAVKVARALIELKDRVESRFSDIPAEPDARIPFMQSKLSITQINGGLKVNIIPDSCEIVFDRRLIPGETVKAAKKEIEDFLNQKVGTLDWKLKWTFETEPYRVKDREVVEMLNRIVSSTTGVGGERGVLGSGDILALAEEKGYSVVGTGVTRQENNMHGKDEFVYLSDVENLAHIIELFVTS